MIFDVSLTSLADTQRLGEALAMALAEADQAQIVLLEGGLGAGKTTLTRFLAEALPGGNEAEVSSPSFTLCNIYPTRPEIRHYDFYRLEYGDPPEEFLDDLDQLEANREDGPVVMLIEWPERLPPGILPGNFLSCRLTAEQNDRRAFFTAHGESAEKILRRLEELLAAPDGWNN